MHFLPEKSSRELFAALSAPEEQGNRAGAGVTADGRSDVVYLDLAVELGEALLYESGDGLASSTQPDCEM